MSTVCAKLYKTVKEIVEAVVDISGKKINVFYDTTKPEGDKARSADFTKAKTILGWEPKVDLRKGLEQQYNWIKSKLIVENEIVVSFLGDVASIPTAHNVGTKKVFITNEQCESNVTQVASG